METPDLKHCPICKLDLPISEFGICRARKDGKNLYCKPCIRHKVTQSRKALREYKAARKQYIAAQIEVAELAFQLGPVVPLSKLSPVERVREVIRRGPCTQSEIQRETKLHKDDIGDALANLLLWTKEIKTKVVDNTRVYFIPEAVETVSYPQKASLVEIARKGLGPVMKGEKSIQRVA